MIIPHADLVHRSRGRLRLRIPSKRQDLGYFVELYEEVRQLPGIVDLVINPKTASVLLIYEEEQHNELSTALSTTGLFMLEPTNQGPGTPALNPVIDTGGRVSAQAAVNDMRVIVFLIMLGVSVHQLLRGQIFAPVLTTLIFAADLGMGFLQERGIVDPVTADAGAQSNPRS